MLGVSAFIYLVSKAEERESEREGGKGRGGEGDMYIPILISQCLESTL